MCCSEEFTTQKYDRQILGLNVSLSGYGIGCNKWVISAIALVASIISINVCAEKDLIKKYPVSAANLLFALYCTGIALYQIVISALIIWKTMKTEGSIFYCNLWYVSHLSITVMYAFFFIARAVACFSIGLYVDGAFTIIAGILYIGVFFYFCVVVNSFSYTINQIIFY